MKHVLHRLAWQSVRSLTAGCAVYGAVAACESASTEGDHGREPSAVPAASAAPQQRADEDAGDASIGARHSHRRLVIEEKCDKRDDRYGAVGEYVLYAEHAFPGKSKEDLSGVRVLFSREFEQNFPSYVPGYTTRVNYWSETGYAAPPEGTLYVKDGSVAVLCGSGRSLQNKSPVVTLVLDEIVAEE